MRPSVRAMGNLLVSFYKFTVCAAMFFAANASARPAAQPCMEELRRQAGHDFHCPADEVVAWRGDEGGKKFYEAHGGGLKATYALGNVFRNGEQVVDCTWERTSAPIADPEAAANELRLDLGAGAPTGLVGVSYQRRLGSIFAIEPGAGWGLSGFQASMLLRLLHLPIIGAPGFGLSVAFGPGPGVLVGPKSGAILWLDAEFLGQEYRFESGLLLSLGIGVVHPVAGEFSVCRAACTAVQSQSFLFPTVRLGVGWWL